MNFDDLVFENRNQQYGAFDLRRLYNDHIIKSVTLGLLGFSMLILGPLVWEKIKPFPESSEEQIVTVDPKMIEPPPIDPKTPPPPPLPATPPPPKVTTVRFVPPEVVPDEEVEEKDPPKQEELKHAQASTETVQGDPSADPNELNIDQVGTGNGEVIGAPVENDEPFLFVDQMPEFPDGDMQVYFSKNLKYPQRALRAEISGKVHMSFVVKADGSITDVLVLKGLGGGCDEEAVRVVSTMPKWNPGKQGGRPVKVRINVQINFKM